MYSYQVNLAEKEFEDQLENELNLQYGLTFQKEFTVHDPISGRNHRVDFYIRGPIRAIVEIRFGDPNINQLIDYSNLIKNLFGGAIDIFFITPNKFQIKNEKQIQIFKKNIHWILLPESGNPEKVVKYCFDIINKYILMKTNKLAKEFKIHNVYPIKKDGFAPIEVIGNIPSSSSYDFPKITKPEFIKDVTKKLGPLEDNLINLKHLIKLSEYEKIEKEFEEFIKEYEQEHYTSCALRVGRSLELMVLSLAQAWNVKINVKVLKIIDELDKDFNELNQMMVDLSDIDPKKIDRYTLSIEKKLDIIQQKFNKYQRSYQKSLYDGNKIEFSEPSTAPLNVNAVMKDIKNQFRHSKHEHIKNELKKIDNAKLISNLLEKRNLAAHLDISGKKREFDKKGIDEMLNNLSDLIHLFNNIADNIKRIE